jgi:enterochelin esterase family protein
MCALSVLVAGVAIGQSRPATSTAPLSRPAVSRPFEDGSKLPQSPQVHADGRVTLRCYAPQAARVELVAGAMQIALGDKVTPLVKGDDGVWSVTVGPLSPDIYDYGFAIDGGLRTVDTANCDIENLKWGSLSVVQVPSDKPSFYDIRDVPHGEVRTLWYKSKALGQMRRVLVYTPPGYRDGSERSYPTLYLLHGSGQEETSWTAVGRANFILDNLIADTKAKPMVVVMPYGHVRRAAAVTADAKALEDAAKLQADFFEELIPLIESKFTVYRDPRQRAVAGLSMGGGQAARYGLVSFGSFAYVGIFSGAMRGTDLNKDLAALTADAKAGEPVMKLVFVGCGYNEAKVPSRMELNEFLKTNKVPLDTHTYPGEHTFQCWRRCLNDFAPRLFQEGTK